MIKEFHGYRISDDGVVYGKTGKELNRHIKHGMWFVRLYIDGCNYDVSIKKLVATVFLDQPNGCDYVIQIDKDMNNLSVSNLKWINKSELLAWKGRACNQYKDGVLVNKYVSSSDAGRKNGVSQAVIRHWCTGKMKDKRGYTWEFS